MKQHFALTSHQNPTNWTGRDSVVTMCLPWMPDHISLAHALITARMNGFVTTVKFHEMIMSRSLLLFISCLVTFKSVQSGSCQGKMQSLVTCKIIFPNKVAPFCRRSTVYYKDVLQNSFLCVYFEACFSFLYVGFVSASKAL